MKKEISKQQDNQALVETLAALLRERREVQAAYLFGSRARGTQMAGSDVDIAVVFGPHVSSWRELDLQEHLASQLGVPVQVIDLDHAVPHIVEAVQRDGVVLIAGPQPERKGHSTVTEPQSRDPRADEAVWLLDSTADKVQRIDSAAPLLNDIDPDAVLAGDVKAVRDFLGVFLLLIEPLETLVRRIACYAHLVPGYEAPEPSLRAQTELAAQVLGISEEALEAISGMMRLRGRLVHAYWDLDTDDIHHLSSPPLRAALTHLVERASRFVVVEQSRWQT